MPPAGHICEDCKWCCRVLTRSHTYHYECHAHPPILDGVHDPDKPCAWTFPVVNPDNTVVCEDFKA